MKIINLTQESRIYTSNVYLVLGTWNTLKDVNTLVDVGRDYTIIDEIEKISTGVGKHKVEQVVLTHSHYDHESLLPKICEIFKPTVYAFSRSLNHVNYYLKDGDMLRLGDRIFEVIHTPGHSSDSICLYSKEDSVLFSGDTPVRVLSGGSTYENGFIEALERLARKDIRSIYPGHGDPIFEDCNTLIHNTLKNIKKQRN